MIDERDDHDLTCDGCGLDTFGEGRFTDDDVYLCGPCFDDVPLVYVEGEGLKLVKGNRTGHPQETPHEPNL